MKPSIQELIKRPLLYNHDALEVFNKMTPEELKAWDEYTSDELKREGVPQKFPDWNSALLAKSIDYDILYRMFKEFGMRKEMKIYDGDVTVTYIDTPEVRDKVFERVLQYVKENNASSGETIHQSDNCIINAPDTLSDIVDDILEMEWEGDDE